MANEENNPKKISRNEKTNAKNLENLRVANMVIAELGGLYAPTNPLLKANELTDFEQQFDGLSESVTEKFTAEQNAVGIQLAAFKLVSKRVTRTMKAVKAQGLTEEFVGHLQTTVNRLNGVRVDKNMPDASPGAPAAGTSSVSRRSYAGILDSLRLFAQQLTSNPAYNPNEPEYKSATITAWVEELEGIHNNALAAKIATRTARNNRNAYAYNETTGLIPRMNALKNYLATILSSDDPRLKQIKKLKFVDNTK